MTEVVRHIAGGATGGVVLTCEHASNRLPEGWTWPAEDAAVREAHWAWDPGAALLCEALAAQLDAPAVLSGFSRLLIDPNRPLDSDTLLRTSADGQPIALNRSLADRARRISVAYQPYHDAVHALVADHPQCLVFSVHSFTDAYEGVRREVEVGVLFDRDEAPARHLLASLSPHYDARLNEPWDGRGGMMYSAQSHASAHGAQALEIEVRQDLLADPAWRRDLAGRLATALRTVAAAR